MLIFALFFVSKTVALAESEAGASATLKTNSPQETLEEKDLRFLKLKKLFASYNSPFEDEEAEAFLVAAEINQLDWRLLPAITGIESTFGRFLPFNSFNPFGWGIYGNQVTLFASYQEAIETVAYGIAQNYPYRQGIFALAYAYCPPNANRWANKVISFMEEIENMPVASQDSLVITL